MSISRRELLTVLLGASLASAACRRARIERVQGTIRGGSVGLGHKLQQPLIAPPSATPTEVPVVIVGAGPSGLCAAWQLLRSGHDQFLVFDLERTPGGTSTYGTDGVVPYPWGAHYVPLPSEDNPDLRALLREMGMDVALEPLALETEAALVRAPEERLFVGGQWHEGLYPEQLASADDRAQLQRFNEHVSRYVNYRDARGRRAFTLPVANCSDDSEITALDHISAAQWLRQNGFTSKLLHWFVEYGCRDDYGTRLGQTSAWAMMFYFASRVGQAGSESAPFLTWPEGNGRLVRHLAAQSGDRVRGGQLVTDLEIADDGVLVSVYDAATGTLARYRTQYVIVAAPKFIARRLLRELRDDANSPFADFSYSPWLVANLHLHGRPRVRGAALAWDNVLYDSPSLGYVVATHQALRDRGPTVWTYYLPMLDADVARARRELLAADHAGLCDAIVSDLSTAHPDLLDFVERIDVWRWGHAMVRPVPGFIWGKTRRAAAEPLRGRVFFAHSDSSGVALFEEAQASGVRAARDVLARLRA